MECAATAFQPCDPDFAARVRGSFGRQAAMRLIGAELAVVEPGRVVVGCPTGRISRSSMR